LSDTFVGQVKTLYKDAVIIEQYESRRGYHKGYIFSSEVVTFANLDTNHSIHSCSHTCQLMPELIQYQQGFHRRISWDGSVCMEFHQD
jgi:hypothetical protein